jgi:hypothetical protein
MSEMIERVAKAIQAKCLERGYRECPASLIHHVAAAAIEAIREPTEEMCNAADWQQQSEVNQYQRAIDAALGKVDA